MLSKVFKTGAVLAILFGPFNASANGYSGYIDSLDVELQRHIQLVLSEKGFDPGPIDGIFGPKSQAALHRFKIFENLLVSGETELLLTPELIRALFDIEVDPGVNGFELSGDEERALMERLGLVHSQDSWQLRNLQVPD